MPMTLDKALSQYPRVQFFGIDETIARALTVQTTVDDWTDEQFGHSLTWSVAGVPRPKSSQHIRGDSVNVYRWRQDCFLCDGYVFVVWEVERSDNMDRTWEVYAYPRTPDKDYWPSEQECKDSVIEWAQRLYKAMLEVVGNDCDTGPDVTPAQHWTDAKRRYTIKNNSTRALLYCARLDPEGRHRCLYDSPMPDHVERWVRYADFLCGVMAGVDAGKINESDMYASGGQIESDELLAWCRSTWASGLTVEKISS